MFAFFKAIFLGAFLTAIVALFIGSGGASGGFLHVFGFTVEGYHLYWSWPLFVIGSALSFGILILME